jgi:hypothetical protein
MHVDSKQYLFNMIEVTPTPAEVARLRCDPAVKLIEHDTVVSIGAIKPDISRAAAIAAWE